MADIVSKLIEGYKRQGRLGKILYGVLTLFVLCCLCSFPLALLNPLPSSNIAQSEPPTVDASSIQTAAVDTLVAGINQTLTVKALTETLKPVFTEALFSSETPTYTDTPLYTSTPPNTATITDTPQVTLPAGIASCIPNNTLRETAVVLGIVDGDTINVQLNGQIVPVRYIGIDAPATGKEYYGQAAQINQDLVYAKTVTLITDNSNKDNNGNLLRYVIVDNVFVNLEIIKQGYALAVSVPPDIACSTTFTNAQSQAQATAIGIWVPTLAPYFPPSNNPPGGCCKYCGPNSKACGDGCISLSYTCHQPPGCACD